MDENKHEVIGGIVLSVNVTKEDIEDLLVTALESGVVEGWCDDVSITGERLGATLYEHVSNGGEVKLFDAEDTTGIEFWRMSREDLIRGWQLAMQADAVGGYTIEDLSDHRGTGVKFDMGSIDAEGADIILQYALFGEVQFS